MESVRRRFAGMIIDVTGVSLTPGNCGKDCLGNGEHLDQDGNFIDCCCNECEYMMCCVQTRKSEQCLECMDRDCPHAFIK